VAAIQLQQRLLHRVLGVLHTAQQPVRHAEHEPRLPLRHLGEVPVALRGVNSRGPLAGFVVVQIGIERELQRPASHIPRQHMNRKPHLARPLPCDCSPYPRPARARNCSHFFAERFFGELVFAKLGGPRFLPTPLHLKTGHSAGRLVRAPP
jgi:hypothetical protein